MSLDAYKRNMTAYGITGESSDRLLNSFISDLKNTFKDNFSHESVTIENTLKDVHIISNSSIDSSPNKKIMLSYPTDNYNKGLYVVWGDTNWIIYDIDDNKKVQNRCEIYRCNNVLKGIDSNGKINEYDCLVKSMNASSDGIDNNKYFDTISNTIEITIQRNIYTESISEGDRFIFGKSVYRCGKIIDYTREGIITFYMEFDEKSDNDNFDLGVADYYNRNVYNINIPEGDIEVSSASTSQLSVIVTENGVAIEKNVTWVSSDELIATVDSNGLITTISDGNCTITAYMTDNDTVTTNINLVVTSVISDNFEIVVNPNNTTIRLNEIVDFNIRLLNNSVDTTDTFTFSIIGGTAETSDYEFNVVDGNNFNLKNNQEGKNIIIRMESGIHVLDKTIEFIWLY